MLNFFRIPASRSVGRISAFGFLAGVANGLLGAGGGILIVFGLSPLTAGNAEARRDVFANALCVMLPVSLISLIAYASAGRIPSEAELSPILIPCVLGGAAGALFLHRVNASLLQKLFALIVIWSGAAMIFF